MFNSSTFKSRRAVPLNAMLTALFLLITAPTLMAQAESGSITITIDPPTSDIMITLSGTRDNRRPCRTTSEGRCVFMGLEAATYEVLVTNAGAPISVVLMPGQSFALRIPLPPPGPETVLLAAQPPSAVPPSGVASLSLMDKSIPGRRGEVTTALELELLPNRNQNEAALPEGQPGTFSTGATDTFGGFIFNGQPASQNVLREAGLNSNIIVRSAASFQDTNALLINARDRQSIKAYSSFGLDTSNTPAALGTGTGGQLIKNVNSGGEKWAAEFYEYLANDAFSARNFFDFARKPSLRFNLFGVNLSGRIHGKLFGFVNYEGLRASSGNTIFAAAPKLSLASQSAPATAPLLSSFRAGGAFVTGTSSDPNFDILQLDTKNLARRDGITARFDRQLKDMDKIGFVYLGSRSKEDIPDGLSGRRNVSLDISHRGIFNWNRTLKTNDAGTPTLTNQFIFGVINEPSQVFARYDAGGNPDLSRSAISIGGEIGQTGIPDQSESLSIATAGGLLRSDFDGRSLHLTPWQISFADQLVWQANATHSVTLGGELRLLRTRINRRYGTSYKFATLADFLANRASVEHSSDLGSFTGNVGSRRVDQEYYIAYAQDAWQIRPNFLFTYGLRYEYYTPLHEDQDRAVILDLRNGALAPAGTPFYQSRKTSFLPRIAFAWAPGWKGAELRYGPTVFSGSFGMHTGPDAFNNILRPVTNDRLVVSGAGLAFPADPPAVIAAANREDAKFTPLLLSRDYQSPVRVYKFDLTIKQDLITRETRNPSGADKDNILKEMFFTLSYVGNRSRNLPLRNVGNRIISVETNPNAALPARVKREFDIERGPELLHPYGELDVLTTGGRASYDSFQGTFQGRLKRYLRLFQVDYTLAYNRGNTDGDDAIATGHPLDYNYDFGYNAADLRHKAGFIAVFAFNCPSDRICSQAVLKHILSDLTFATKGMFQSGTPIDVRLKRPDVVYIDQSGNVFSSPANGRRAVLNVPGGGSSVPAYRPNLIPGVNPYLNGDRMLLNPAAFSIPAPGTLGNLTRGALRGPNVALIDLSVVKKFNWKSEERIRTLSLNVDITNVSNHPNFKTPSAKLDSVLGTDDAAHQLQPGQPFTLEAAGNNFGVMNRTFKRKADLGASRQIQFGISLAF